MNKKLKELAPSVPPMPSITTPLPVARGSGKPMLGNRPTPKPTGPKA